MSDIVTSRVFTDGEKGITAAKLNDIVASSVIQPAFYTSKPTASTVNPADIALILQSGAYAQTPISALGGAATQAQIWSTRLRSFNSIGNPNFEVDQRNVGNVVTNPTGGTFIQDRWTLAKTGTMTVNTQQTVVSAVPVPGTSFAITSRMLVLTLTAQQASLGASDSLSIIQTIEGPQLRELITDVHSISLLVSSTVAGLSFSVSLRDSPPTKSLVKLCTIPTANTWTLITLPNIPVWPTANFALSPGAVGYTLNINLAAGPTVIAPAADTWQNGNFIGAPGMNNFAASPVNSIVRLAMVQHEPGALCTTFIDKPFAGANGNLDECLRYYCKSYDYGTPIATSGTTSGHIHFLTSANTTWALGWAPFPKPMALVPTTLVTYGLTGGANNGSVFGGSAVAVASKVFGQKGLNALNITTAQAVGTGIQFHYLADTGM